MNMRALAAFLATLVIVSSTACASGADTSAALKTGMNPTAKPAATATAKPAATAAAKGSAAAPTAAPAKGQADGKPATVPLPDGATKYDGARVVKIGEAVELPASNLVVQVSNVRIADKDAQNDWVLADVVIGNKGKEKEPISSVVSFHVVTDDWRWYGLSLQEAMAKVAKDVTAGVQTTLFDDDVEPGQAKKGTAMAIVPKSAKNLALVYQSSKIVALPNEPHDPLLFVSLGLRGDWPGLGVPDDGVPASASDVYKVGQAFKLPKSGIVMRINRVWERATPGKQAKLDADKKFVFIDVSMKKPAGVNSLEPRSEFAFVTSDGAVRKNLEPFSQIYGDENTRMLNQDMGRGVLVGIVPKSATGLALKVMPVGKSGDVAFVDLGLGGAYVATAAASPTTKAGATPTAAKTPTPTGKATPTPATKATATPSGKATATPAPARPSGIDTSEMPSALKNLPVPAGFDLSGWGSGGGTGDNFDFAEATWLGTLGVIETSNFYSKALSSEWTVSEGEASEDRSYELYVNNDDENLTLEVTIEKTDQGTEATLSLSKS